ncbi:MULTISPECIES: hypothetical protein [Spirulina sp. CCY15215]|uniref:hypothetical protein n=1 Tax=Spirulina sp. CCY15215 TaxID=2767591 RepID=UPI00194FA5A5|nr:hypothetical protein [Spirulina major]
MFLFLTKLRSLPLQPKPTRNTKSQKSQDIVSLLNREAIAALIFLSICDRLLHLFYTQRKR